MAPDEPGASGADGSRAARSRSFGAAAEHYVAGRPGYPQEAVEWLVGGAADIADVGAGTGKLTAALVGEGRRVLAVEPDAVMLATLRREVPQAQAAAGS